MLRNFELNSLFLYDATLHESLVTEKKKVMEFLKTLEMPSCLRDRCCE